jgi:hypothetical protein
MDEEPRLTQDWKDSVNETLKDHEAAIRDYRSMKGWLLGLAAGVGGTVGFLAKEFSAFLGRH